MKVANTGIDVPLTQLAAREHVLHLFALAVSDPASRRFSRVEDGQLLELACAGARFLAQDPRSRPVSLAPGEDPPARLCLDPLARAVRAPRARLERDHARVFGPVPRECPPFEVDYWPRILPAHRSRLVDDIAGFYHIFGVEPASGVPGRPDHLACELEFLGWLVARERHARAQQGRDWDEHARICRDGQRIFVGEHLSWWVPAFARALGERARSLEPLAPLHAALAEALACLVPIERAILGVDAPAVLPSPEPAPRPSQRAARSAR